MHLLHTTLLPPSTTSSLITGAFSKAGEREFVCAKGRVLDLLRLDKTSSTLKSVNKTDLFAEVRKLHALRLSGQTRDLIIVTTDSGQLTILRYDDNKRRFERADALVFGKSGMRRNSPGHHLAVDQHGRAIMLASVERDKLVFKMDRDSSDRLVISSPLEAHNPRAVTFSVVSLDVGLDNPMFCCIEQALIPAASSLSSSASSSAAAAGVAPPMKELAEGELALVSSSSTPNASGLLPSSSSLLPPPRPPHHEKDLVYYDLDLGLNTMKKRYSFPIPSDANMLIPMPGGAVIVCHGASLTYRAAPTGSSSAPPPVVRLPRRSFDSPASLPALVISHSSFQTGSSFLALLQTERGDLFRITPPTPEQPFSVKYFDSVPPATGIAITKPGYMYVASESGNHLLYRFVATGEDEDSFVANSTTPPSVEFTPRPPHACKNIVHVQTIPCASPITAGLCATGEAPPAAALASLAPIVPPLVLGCGAGPASRLVTVRPGASTRELPLNAQAFAEEVTGVWVVPTAAVVFSTNETTTATGITPSSSSSLPALDRKSRTLLMARMNDEGILQVTRGGWRRLNKNGSSATHEWRTIATRLVERACVFGDHLVIALGGGAVLWFRAGPGGGLDERARQEMGAPVTAIDTNGRYLAVGLGRRTTVLHLEGEAAAAMTLVGHVAVPTSSAAAGAANSQPKVVSLALIDFTGGGLSTLLMGDDEGGLTRRTVSGGAVLRGGDRVEVSWAKEPVKLARVSPTQGSTTGGVVFCYTSKRVLLARAPSSLQPLNIAIGPAATSSWKFAHLAPFFFYATPPEQTNTAIATSDHPSIPAFALVAMDMNRARASSRTFLVEGGPDEKFTLGERPLEHTPRRVVRHPRLGEVVIVAEGDRNAVGFKHRRDLVRGVASSNPHSAPQDGGGDDSKKRPKREEMNVDEEEDYVASPEERVLGYPKPEQGSWTGVLRLLHVGSGKTIQRLELEPGECATSMIVARMGGKSLLVVGTAVGLSFVPPPVTFTAAKLRVYRFEEVTGRLAHVHTTSLPDVPGALLGYEGQLLVGVGGNVRIYELGMKQMLLKGEVRSAATDSSRVVSLSTYSPHDSSSGGGGERDEDDTTPVPGVGDRFIVVGDARESFTFLRRDPLTRGLLPFADDAVARPVTSCVLPDPRTVFGGDRFGNVFALRLPEDATGEDAKSRAAAASASAGPASGGALWEQAKFGGAPHRLELTVHFFVGEAVTGLRVMDDGAGGGSLLYTTVSGAMGALIPMRVRDDVDFFVQLEARMRKQGAGRISLAGRDHFQFRSTYAPVKGVVDGDFCAGFRILPSETQNSIAKEMDRSVEEIIERLDKAGVGV